MTVAGERELLALGRPERAIDVSLALLRLQSERVLVTGASGAIGQPLVHTMREAGVHVVATDIDTTGVWGCTYMDVTDFQSVLSVVAFHEPTIIINLAASKLAPAGELDPWRAVNVNTVGLMNVLRMGRKVVQASTCKAADPETAYGASKLISERLVLNAGGTVLRYYNVPECGPSVLTIWDELPADEPLPVTPCTRYLISYREAIALTLWGCVLAPGRYAIDPGEPVAMTEYAARLYPDRAQVSIPPRRGDRLDEPLCAESEAIYPGPVRWINEIRNPCDPERRP